MAISPSLKQFVSSGVYRLTFDKSQTISVPSQTIRLVIGFSKKGVFNTPVYCADTEFFTSVYGDIDSTLERKGSFFHRTALTCLTRGPIIALNLLSLDDSLDKSQFESISTSSTDVNSSATLAPVSNYYNRDKFWYPDAEELKTVAGTQQTVTTDRLLNVANIGRKPVSVILRKSDALGYDVLAKDWYGVGKVPVFLNDNDYMSDYMIDVIVLDGSFADYSTLLTDPIFGPYFDANGLKKTYTDSLGKTKDGLTAFLNLKQVNVLGVYTGSLIPQFQDKMGNNIFIQDLVNLETYKTGVLLSVNQDLFDEGPVTIAGEDRYISGDIVDLVGHTLESEKPATIDFLSYSGVVISPVSFTIGGTAAATYTTIVGASSIAGLGANARLSASTELASATGYVAANHFDTITFWKTGSTSIPTGYTASPIFVELSNRLTVGKSFLPVTSVGVTSTVNYAELQTVAVTPYTITAKIKLTVGSNVVGPTSTSTGFLSIKATGVTAGGGTASIKGLYDLNISATNGATLAVGPDSEIFTKMSDGTITSGDSIQTGSTGADYTEFGLTLETGNELFGAIEEYLTAPVYLSKNINQYILTTNYGASPSPSIFNPGSISIKTSRGSVNETFTAEFGNNPTNIIWAHTAVGNIVKGDYLVANLGGTGSTSISPVTGKSRLTKVVSVIEDLSYVPGETWLKVTTVEPIYISDAGQVERYKDIRNFIDNYKILSLTGYTLRDAQVPDGSLTRQNQILDVMYNTNLAQALADREVISYRYIVDTFEGAIEPESKSRLSILAKNRENAFAILNMPSVKQFKESVNPLFKANAGSAFESYYIGQGGNMDLNPSNYFSLPSVDNGANFAAWYGPNLIVREKGSNLSVPAAAYVSNLYVNKMNQGNPYDIIAGPRRGVVSGSTLVGVEYNFDRPDLDSIEPFGYNAIINKRGFGLTINANQTGQQSIQSALSQAHVRELVIYIQDGIENILKNYRWEFNTAQIRLEIKTLADNFLSQIAADGGVYWFNNVMDTTNNTSDIIDANMGILDTYIEPVRGLGILVHRTTILKTGQAVSGIY